MPNPEINKAGNNINFQTEINTAVTQLLMTENEINAHHEIFRHNKFLATCLGKIHKGKTLLERERFCFSGKFLQQ